MGTGASRSKKKKTPPNENNKPLSNEDLNNQLGTNSQQPHLNLGNFFQFSYSSL